MKVRELMERNVDVVYKGNTIRKAVDEMTQHNRGLLVVLDDAVNRNVVGVISNKDVVEAITADKDIDAVTVADCMNPDVISIDSESTAADASVLMQKHRIKRLVVIDNGILQGIISSTDITDHNTA